jgi:cellulose synthase/poly-beta-1,6-N-acetylglucosamine synthase-like glycosyltransferase
VTAAAALLAAIALVLVAWSYVGYPSFVTRLARRTAPRELPLAVSETPAVEAIVSAFDEEEAIGPRVANLLAQEFAGELSVAVGCDGCSDETARRARDAGGPRVRVVEFGERRGKAAVVNDLVQTSSAEILVFTDANTEFEPAAVSRLVARFADRRVGAVCGRLVLEERNGGGPTPETEFWDFESRLKETEGRLGVCLGANGAIYAARRSLVRPLPEGAILDDFLIAARIAAEGHRVVFAGDAVAREPLPRDVRAEASRRFRIGIGAGRVLRGEPRLLDVRRRPLLSLVFFSRKAARWLAPVLAGLAIVLGFFSRALAPCAIGAAAALLLLAASIALRPRLPGWAGRAYYFVVINVALAAGVVAGLAGYRRPAWPRTAR